MGCVLGYDTTPSWETGRNATLSDVRTYWRGEIAPGLSMSEWGDSAVCWPFACVFGPFGVGTPGFRWAGGGNTNGLLRYVVNGEAAGEGSTSGAGWIWAAVFGLDGVKLFKFKAGGLNAVKCAGEGFLSLSPRGLSVGDEDLDSGLTGERIPVVGAGWIDDPAWLQGN